MKFEIVNDRLATDRAKDVWCYFDRWIAVNDVEADDQLGQEVPHAAGPVDIARHDHEEFGDRRSGRLQLEVQLRTVKLANATVRAVCT